MTARELRIIRSYLVTVLEHLLAAEPAAGVNQPSSRTSDSCSALKDVNGAIAHLDTAISQAEGGGRRPDDDRELAR